MYSIRILPNVQHPPIPRPRTKQRPIRATPAPTPKPSTVASDIECLLDKAIEHANEACGADNSRDTDCIIAWDEVNDLTKAYHQAVDKEKKEEVKAEDDFMTRLTPNSWDVLI